ncbi:MAG: replication initiation protein [Oscillospiraceae bacterium]|nr:replication initiation protein [Oscillospiraceae bacterium]
MANVKGFELVEKRNVLNQIRRNNMTLQELRLFSIYLAKINARDISTRILKFPLKNFCKIMNIEIKLSQIRENTYHLLQQIVEIPNEDGTRGFTAIQLFKECKLSQDKETGQWFFEIVAHDKAVPYMFDFKERYFTYELWNVLRLKSANQLRMYEILKQYEHFGKRRLSLTELRELLCISPKEYSRWGDFKKRVLDACQQALAEQTDITFTYEPIRTGHKFTAVTFFIRKNENFVDPLRLEDYINTTTGEIVLESPKNEESPKRKEWIPLSPDTDDDTANEIYGNEEMAFLAQACDYEFSPEEMRVLFDYLLAIGFVGKDNSIRRYQMLRRAYNKLNAAPIIPKRDSDEENVHKRRFGFIKWLFEDKYEFDI